MIIDFYLRECTFWITEFRAAQRDAPPSPGKRPKPKKQIFKKCLPAETFLK